MKCDDFLNRWITGGVARRTWAKMHAARWRFGSVLADLATALEKSPPLLAATECGAVLASGALPKFDDVNIEGWPEGGSDRRGLMGLKTMPAAGADRFVLNLFDRISKILQDEDRSPGIDLISRGGRVHVVATETAPTL